MFADSFDIEGRFNSVEDLSLYTGYHEMSCHRCKEYGMVIACDYCPLVYHPTCLFPELKKQPVDYWVCPVCLRNIQDGELSLIEKRRNNFSSKTITIPLYSNICTPRTIL